MMYQYQNAKGEHREIVASMKDHPPEKIVIAPDGSWRAAGPYTEPNAIFTRVYTTGAGYVNRFSAWRSPVTGKGLDGALDKGHTGR